MEYSDKVVSVISECVAQAVKKTLSEYNIQTSEKLKNIIITGANIKPLSITSGSIATGAINNQHIANVDAAKIGNLTTEVMNTVVANISKADIDWAEIDRLNAATADIVNAEISNAEITSAQIKDLETTTAEIAAAQIGSADIGFAQIKDLATNTAIITEGVGGELYISRLAVTEANMVSLTTGRLLIKNEEGQFCQIAVVDGEVVSIPVSVEGTNIAEGTISGSNIANETIQGGHIASNTVAGTHLIEDTITARELNVSQIFAEEAVMVEITANMGKFADLFANEAVVEQLKVHLIESDYMKVLIQENVNVGGRNLVLKSDENYSNDSYIIASYDFGTMPPVDGEIVTIRLSGALGDGKNSFGIYNSGELHICNLSLQSDGTYSQTVVWRTSYFDDLGNEIEVPNTHVEIRAQENNVADVISVIDWIKVERGNKATDYTPAPEDTEEDISDLIAQIEKTSELIMTEDEIISAVTSSVQFKEATDIAIGGRNFIKDSGNFSTVPESWMKDGVEFLEWGSVDERPCLCFYGVISDGIDTVNDVANFATSGILGMGKLGLMRLGNATAQKQASIYQDKIYQLEFDTTYVYHTRVMADQTLSVDKAFPIDFYASLLNDAEGIPTNRNAIAYIEVLSSPTIREWTWEHVVIRFRTVEKTGEQNYIGFRPIVKCQTNEGVSAQMRMQWIMLENSTTPSDWVPAPEDIEDATNKNKLEIGSLESRVRSAEERIEDDRIINLVTQSSVYRNELEQVEQAAVEQTIAHYDIRFKSVESVANNALEETSELKSSVESWFNFSKEAILEIGRSDNHFRSTFSNEELAFWYLASKLAYFGIDGLYVNRARVLNELQLGNIRMTTDSSGRMVWL